MRLVIEEHPLGGTSTILALECENEADWLALICFHDLSVFRGRRRNRTSPMCSLGLFNTTESIGSPTSQVGHRLHTTCLACTLLFVSPPSRSSLSLTSRFFGRLISHFPRSTFDSALPAETLCNVARLDNRLQGQGVELALGDFHTFPRHSRCQRTSNVRVVNVGFQPTRLLRLTGRYVVCTTHLPWTGSVGKCIMFENDCNSVELLRKAICTTSRLANH